MSIRTRRGDRGETDLLYSRRVPKSDFRIAAIGGIDECTSALGLARVLAPEPVEAELAIIQADLIALMGEVAVDPGDAERYVKDHQDRIGLESVARLDEAIDALEGVLPKVSDWVIPGASGSELAARFDHARSIIRRAERDLVDLAEIEPTFNQDLLVYLNRLGDLVWLRAREAEEGQGRDER